MSITEIVSTNFEKAMSTLAKLDLSNTDTSQSLNAFIPLIQRLEVLAPDHALFIGRVMQQSSVFNEVVRTHISSVEIGARFITISKEFDSIRDDTKDMVLWMEDGDLSPKT